VSIGCPKVLHDYADVVSDGLLSPNGLELGTAVVRSSHLLTPSSYSPIVVQNVPNGGRTLLTLTLTDRSGPTKRSVLLHPPATRSRADRPFHPRMLNFLKRSSPMGSSGPRLFAPISLGERDSQRRIGMFLVVDPVPNVGLTPPSVRYNHLIRTSGERGSGRERRKQQTAPYPPSAAAAVSAVPNQLPSGQPPHVAAAIPGIPGAPLEHPGHLEHPQFEHQGHIMNVADFERSRHATGGPGMPPPPGAVQYPPPTLGLELPPLRLPQQPSPGSNPASALMQIDPQLQHHSQLSASSLPPPTGPPGPQGPQLGISRDHTPTTPSVSQPHSAYGNQHQWAPWSHVA
jgi:hypothetical protein